MPPVARVPLALQEVPGLSGDVFSGQARGAEEFPRLAGGAEPIGDADHVECNFSLDTGPHNGGCDDVAQASSLMLLDR